MRVLVYAEHDNASLKDATLAVVTAAAKLGEVHVLIAGSDAAAAAAAAAKVASVAKVLLADDAAYANQLAENVAPLVAGMMTGYDAFLAPATAHGKNIAPRVAALLDVMQISDILSVEGPKTFTRPTYAGNAIATVESSDAKLVITVRGTAFAKAETTGGSANVETASGAGDAGISSFVSAEIVKSEELLDIGGKAHAVDRTVQHARGIDPVVAQRGKEGERAPFAERGVGHQLLPARSPAPDRRHVRLGPLLSHDPPDHGRAVGSRR